MSVNEVTLIGNLGKDPDCHTFSNGVEVANLSIATSRKWNDKNTGELKQQTEWHYCSIFGKSVNVAKQYLHKGSKIYIKGFLRTEQYTDKEGVARQITKIISNGFTMLGDGKVSDIKQSQENTSVVRQSPPSETQSSAQEVNQFDDDIPF